LVIFDNKKGGQSAEMKQVKLKNRKPYKWNPVSYKNHEKNMKILGTFLDY
jgi:hypothetical protein